MLEPWGHVFSEADRRLLIVWGREAGNQVAVAKIWPSTMLVLTRKSHLYKKLETKGGLKWHAKGLVGSVQNGLGSTTETGCWQSSLELLRLSCLHYLPVFGGIRRAKNASKIFSMFFILSNLSTPAEQPTIQALLKNGLARSAPPRPPS